MSDISLHISWLDLLVLAPVFGWPGLLIGAALGAALFWRRRRMLAGLVGAALGCAIWFAVTIFT